MKNQRFTRVRALGDDPVSAAASAAIAAAGSAVSSNATAAATPRHRRKHHRTPSAASSSTDPSSNAATSATSPAPGAAPAATSGGKKARKPVHPHRGSRTDIDNAPAEKGATPAAQTAAGNGHLLMIGGAAVGLGLLALALMRRGDEPVRDVRRPRAA